MSLQVNKFQKLDNVKANAKTSVRIAFYFPTQHLNYLSIAVIVEVYVIYRNIASSYVASDYHCNRLDLVSRKHPEFI